MLTSGQVAAELYKPVEAPGLLLAGAKMLEALQQARALFGLVGPRRKSGERPAAGEIPGTLALVYLAPWTLDTLALNTMACSLAL